MDRSKWRSSALAVACGDLVMTSGIILLAVLTITWEIINIWFSSDQEAEYGLPWTQRIIWAIIASGACILLWFTAGLPKTLQQKVDTTYALKKAQTWRNTNVAFLVLITIAFAFCQEYVIMTLVAIARSIFIFIECLFIQELKQSLSRSVLENV